MRMSSYLEFLIRSGKAAKHPAIFLNIWDSAVSLWNRERREDHLLLNFESRRQLNQIAGVKTEEIVMPELLSRLEHLIRSGQADERPRHFLRSWNQAVARWKEHPGLLLGNDRLMTRIASGG